MVSSRPLLRVLLQAFLLGLCFGAGYFIAGWWSGIRDRTPLAQLCARIDYVNGLQAELVGQLLEQASGQKIQGWLSPRGTSKAITPKLLAEAGYRWYGDVFDADLPYVLRFGAKNIVAIPLSYDVNDMPSMKYGHTPKMMFDAFNEVIAIAREHDDELRVIVTSHAHIFGHHRGAYYYEKIIEQAVSSPDIWVGTRAQVADHVLSHQG